MTDWSDDDAVDALVRSAYEPVDERRFAELVERAMLPEAPQRKRPAGGRPTSQRWLAGLSAAAAVALVVVVATLGSGDRRPDDVASERASTSAEGPIAAPFATTKPSTTTPSTTVRVGVADGSPAPTPAQLSAALAVIDARIEGLALDADAEVSGDGITIVLSDPADRASVVALATTGGELEFRPVLDGPSPSSGPALPNTATAADSPGPFPGVGDPAVVYELGPAGLGSAAVEAVTRTDSVDPPGLQLTLRAGEEGIDAFNRLARECFDRSPVCRAGALAVVLDGVVISAPMVASPSFERDQIVVGGVFDDQQIAGLIAALRSGAMPIDLVER